MRLTLLDTLLGVTAGVFNPARMEEAKGDVRESSPSSVFAVQDVPGVGAPTAPESCHSLSLSLLSDLPPNLVLVGENWE